MCLALPAFHAITGSDSTSALCGIGKRKGWKVLLQSEKHQDSFGLLGRQGNLDCNIVPQLEAFAKAHKCTKSTARFITLKLCAFASSRNIFQREDVYLLLFSYIFEIQPKNSVAASWKNLNRQKNLTTLRPKGLRQES